MPGPSIPTYRPNEWEILNAIADHVVEHGTNPSIRDVKTALGCRTMGRLYERVRRLVSVGVVKWDGRGIELLVPVFRPTVIPIISGGTVEVYRDGKILVNGEKAEIVWPTNLASGSRRDDSETL